MVHNLNHCIFGSNPRPPSIDTCLHGYVPFRHVDHVHADAVISIAASRDAERLTAEIYGGEIGYLPWQRPGIDLGIKLGRMAEGNPGYVGVVLGSHGLFTWADEARSCYETTLRIVNKAAAWLEANRRKPAFGGAAVDLSTSKDAKPRRCASCPQSAAASRSMNPRSAILWLRLMSWSS